MIILKHPTTISTLLQGPRTISTLSSLSLQPTQKRPRTRTKMANEQSVSPSSPTHSQRGSATAVSSSASSISSQRQTHESKAPTGKADASSTMPRFPLGYKEAATQWWSSVNPVGAERNVLRLIPFLKEATDNAASSTISIPDVVQIPPATDQQKEAIDPYGNREWRTSSIPIAGKDMYLHEYSVGRTDETADETLVMLHGYGAGLGFFYKNFEVLSRAPGWRLFALDMLGMGNSARPPFKIKAKDPEERITEAENWFVDSLEEWRKMKKIERFTLLGHSLGGYVAVSYALKYPGHLNKLILASPVGIPENPYAVKADLPEPTDSTLEREVTQNQAGLVRERNEAAAAAINAAKQPRRPLPGWFVYLWDANISIFNLIRLAGPFGPRLISGWSARRFNHLPVTESQILHDYTYSIWRQRGSGEYVLPYLLAPGAYARRPLINRIQDLGRQTYSAPQPTTPTQSSQNLSSSSASSSYVALDVDQPTPQRETGFPVVMMYGDSDWMDVNGGYAAEQKLNQARADALKGASEQQRQAENGSAKVVIVKKSGHHVYLDNPDEFNSLISKEMEETRVYEMKRRQRQQQPSP